MLVALLFASSIFAADWTPHCSVSDAGLQGFFAEYADAYSTGDHKAMEKLFVPAYWKELEEHAPKSPGKTFNANLLDAVARDDYCFVTWHSTAEDREHEHPVRFRLVQIRGNWKIDGIPAGEGLE